MGRNCCGSSANGRIANGLSSDDNEDYSRSKGANKKQLFDTYISTSSSPCMSTSYKEIHGFISTPSLSTSRRIASSEEPTENKAIYKLNGVLIDERDWDYHYHKWRYDPVNNKRPGPHPNKDHVWNTHPEHFA